MPRVGACKVGSLRATGVLGGSIRSSSDGHERCMRHRILSNLRRRNGHSGDTGRRDRNDCDTGREYLLAGMCAASQRNMSKYREEVGKRFSRIVW